MSQNVEQNQAPEVTPEQNQQAVRKMAEMRMVSLSQLVEIHIQSLTQVMLSSNGVSELQKRQANKALVEAVKFALDFGVGATNAEIRDKGTVYAKETNTLAGVLVQALDTRMIILADKLREQQELEDLASQQTSEERAVEQNVGTVNE